MIAAMLLALSSLVILVTETDQGTPDQEAHVGKCSPSPYKIYSHSPHVWPSFTRSVWQYYVIRV